MTIGRRTFIRSTGVSLALPWLNIFADDSRGKSGMAQPPRRMICICAPLGLHPDNFFPEQSGQDYELSPYLDVLREFRDEFTVISGLAHAGMGSSFAHQASASFLTGAPGAGRPGFRNTISLDQFAAEQIGAQTRFPSLALSGEGSGGLSWTRTGALIAADNSPSRVFARLFLDGNASDVQEQIRRLEDGRSILDDVRDQARSIRRGLGNDDRDKLDEYLTSVREVEKRVESMRKQKDVADDAAKAKSRPALAMERPANGLPSDLRDHAKLMSDIIAIAFQTDKTRVASLLISRDLSAMYYPFLDVKEGHHAASHNNTSEGYERIARFHVSQFAYLASKLDGMKEGNGTVLDNTCLMFLSNLWIGRKHDNTRLPVVLAGGLGGTLKTGRALNYLQAGSDNRKMCSLYLSLMDRFGIQLNQFGDAQTRLQEL